MTYGSVYSQVVKLNDCFDFAKMLIVALCTRSAIKPTLYNYIGDFVGLFSPSTTTPYWYYRSVVTLGGMPLSTGTSAGGNPYYVALSRTGVPSDNTYYVAYGSRTNLSYFPTSSAVYSNSSTSDTVGSPTAPFISNIYKFKAGGNTYMYVGNTPKPSMSQGSLVVDSDKLYANAIYPDPGTYIKGNGIIFAGISHNFKPDDNNPVGYFNGWDYTNKVSSRIQGSTWVIYNIWDVVNAVLTGAVGTNNASIGETTNSAVPGTSIIQESTARIAFDTVLGEKYISRNSGGGPADVGVYGVFMGQPK
jgi:hypothetical protein